jgi:hypothetical protein
MAFILVWAFLDRFPIRTWYTEVISFAVALLFTAMQFDRSTERGNVAAAAYSLMDLTVSLKVELMENEVKKEWFARYRLFKCFAKPKQKNSLMYFHLSSISAKLCCSPIALDLIQLHANFCQAVALRIYCRELAIQRAYFRQKQPIIGIRLIHTIIDTTATANKTLPHKCMIFHIDLRYCTLSIRNLLINHILVMLFMKVAKLTLY